MRVVAGGDALVASAITRLLERFVSRPKPGARIPESLDRLTDREVEALKQVARGLFSAEIARSLHLNEATVKTHMT